MPRSLPHDIWQLIFDELIGDLESLAYAGLVSHSWRTISLPRLLRNVDLSCHNLGRRHEREFPEPDGRVPGLFVHMAGSWDEWRPENLVPRQRAFLRLMINRPELARYVRSFTWTLVWLDFGEEPQDLTEVDLQGWDVFASLQNVTRLDLASISRFDSGIPEYTRQIPPRLFPAVTDLRLLGWMSRRLVKTIIHSLDLAKLGKLSLDRLQDEGVLPGGDPLPCEQARENCRSDSNPYEDEGIIDDQLLSRQEKGDAAIFPGSMWYPLRVLRQYSLPSLAHLRITMGRFGDGADDRADITMFHEITEFIRSAKDTLNTISIEMGEHFMIYSDVELLPPGFIRGRARCRAQYFDQISSFLHRFLPVLTIEKFPRLKRVHLAGFRVLRGTKSLLRTAPDPELTWQYIRECPFVNEEFIDIPNDDYVQPWLGYNYELANTMTRDQLDELDTLLQRS